MKYVPLPFFLLRYTIGLDTAENILIAFENIIRLSAGRISLSADALIASVGLIGGDSILRQIRTTFL